jgi:hypothetical protein
MESQDTARHRRRGSQRSVSSPPSIRRTFGASDLTGTVRVCVRSLALHPSPVNERDQGVPGDRRSELARIRPQSVMLSDVLTL